MDDEFHAGPVAQSVERWIVSMVRVFVSAAPVRGSRRGGCSMFMMSMTGIAALGGSPYSQAKLTRGSAVAVYGFVRTVIFGL